MIKYNNIHFNSDIIKNAKKKKEVEEILPDILGGDYVYRLNNDLEWMKKSEIVGIRENKPDEIVFFNQEKHIFFQIEPHWRRLWGQNMYVEVRPILDSDNEPQTVTVNEKKYYTFDWNQSENLKKGIQDMDKSRCNQYCTLKTCKIKHDLMSLNEFMTAVNYYNKNFYIDNNLNIRKHQTSITPKQMKSLHTTKQPKSGKLRRMYRVGSNNSVGSNIYKQDSNNSFSTLSGSVGGKSKKTKNKKQKTRRTRRVKK